MIAAVAACGAVAQHGNSLAVPQITLGNYGLYTVADCPTAHSVLDVQLHEGEFAIDMVKIYTNGMLIQSIPINEDDAIVRKEVHFLDANFDGKVDILVGPGTNREYSALFLWSDDEQKFMRATNDGFNVFNGDFFYEPERMAVYRRTSSSFAETTYMMMVWQGTDLQSEETFLIIGDKSYYDSYHVTHCYTLRNYYSDEDIISTDDPSRFQGTWPGWAITHP